MAQLILRKLNKLVAILVTIVFSNSAAAVIIEGSFSGLMWEWQNTNMEITSDATFFSDENAHSPFTGTFWYDTELAGPAVVGGDPWGATSATYSGQHNWLHTTLVGANGAKLDLTSSGQAPTFTANPTENIIVEQYDDGSEYYDRIFLTYEDNDGQSKRQGSLTLESDIAFLNNLGLIQNRANGGDSDSIAGYIYFENSGTLNGVNYFGWVVGELSNFEIHVREPVAVPEPSSLLLFLGPVLLLLWRSGLLPRRVNRKN